MRCLVLYVRQDLLPTGASVAVLFFFEACTGNAFKKLVIVSRIIEEFVFPVIYSFLFNLQVEHPSKRAGSMETARCKPLMNRRAAGTSGDQWRAENAGQEAA